MRPFLKQLLLGLGLLVITHFLPAVEFSRPAKMGPDGFLNRYDHNEQLPGGFLLWQMEQWWYDLPKPPGEPPANVPPDLNFIHHPGLKTAVTWIGHSSVLLQLDGLNILTDPIFSDYASPTPPFGPKRFQPPGLTMEELPHIDVVLISHNHYDHMDEPSLIALSQQPGGPPLFLVPLGNLAWFRSHIPDLIYEGSRQNVFELDWDDQHTVHGSTGDVVFHFDAVQHWSERSLWDRNATLWGSWAVIHPKFRFWFSGDLGYSKDAMDIGKKYGGFDFAAIAIGAYEPRWFMKEYHVNPTEAVQVMLDVKAKQAMGVHWGTFPLSDESLDQPPKDLKDALKDKHLPPDIFFVLHQGETRKLD